MPFNGAGIYTPSAADFPAQAGTLILSTKSNNNINDIATALSNCVTRDGQSAPTANLPMGGFKFVNVADGTSRASPVANFASLGQVQDGGVWWAGTAGGTADALTLTMTPAVPAYVAGQQFIFKSGASPNTGAATVAISGLAAKALQNGGIALTASQIEANKWYRILYDGVAFQLSSVQLISLSGTNAFTGLVSVIDGNFTVIGSADATKRVKFEVDGLTTATDRTLTAQDASGSLALTSEFAYQGLPSSSGRLLLPNDYISGFTLTNNGVTGFDIAAGQARDSTNAANILGTALANKSQLAWAVGAAAGGRLSAAAMAVNTWYYWYALWKTSDGTVDYGFDVATTPTMPSGYSLFRYIGARKTQLAATNWDTFIQHGDEVLWSTPPALDVNGTAQSTANRTLTTVNTPAIKVLWKGNVTINASAGVSSSLLLTDPAVADVAVNITASTLGALSLGNATAVLLRGGAQLSCWTNSSSQIGVRGVTAEAVYIQTTGWVDPRGRPV